MHSRCNHLVSLDMNIVIATVDATTSMTLMTAFVIAAFFRGSFATTRTLHPLSLLRPPTITATTDIDTDYDGDFVSVV